MNIYNSHSFTVLTPVAVVYSYLKPTAPYLKPTTPYLKPTAPYLKPTAPYLKPTAPYFKPTAPYLKVVYITPLLHKMKFRKTKFGSFFGGSV